MQNPTAPLRTKLKLSGLNGTALKGAASPRSKLETSSTKRDRSLVSDGGYDPVGLLDERSLLSDSSSETSDQNRESRKCTPNNPPLKYNRAFR